MKGNRPKRDRCGMIYEVVSNRDLGRVILNCRGLSIASPRYIRDLTNVSFIYLDEDDFFPPDQQQGAPDVSEIHCLIKSLDRYGILCSRRFIRAHRLSWRDYLGFTPQPLILEPKEIYNLWGIFTTMNGTTDPY